MSRFMHPSEGRLRELVDEPLLVPDRIKDHVLHCARCTRRLQTVAAEAAAAARRWERAPTVVVNSAAALAAVQARLQQTARSPRIAGNRRMLPRRLAEPGRPAAIGVTLALLLAAAGTGTAIAGVQWTTILAPTSVASVPVTPAELLALPHLSEFGTVTHSESRKLQAEPSLAQAEADAGVNLRLPAVLPKGVAGSPSVYLLRSWSATFTFSAARAQAAASSLGAVLPALPPGVDGTKLRESVGPGVLVVWGESKGSRPFGSLPTLAIAAVRPPILASTGATVPQLEHYLLELPWIPASLATAIRQLGNPVTTLPIPVLPALGQSETTTINGNRAVLFAGNSPLLSAVVWEDHGTVRAVGGLQEASAVLALARG